MVKEEIAAHLTCHFFFGTRKFSRSHIAFNPTRNAKAKPLFVIVEKDAEKLADVLPLTHVINLSPPSGAHLESILAPAAIMPQTFNDHAPRFF